MVLMVPQDFDMGNSVFSYLLIWRIEISRFHVGVIVLGTNPLRNRDG